MKPFKEVLHAAMGSPISKMTPSAAVGIILNAPICRGVYSLWVKTSDELEMRKRINLQLKKILHELSENTQINKKSEM